MAAPLLVLLWTRMRRLATEFLALAERARVGTLRTYPGRAAAARGAPGGSVGGSSGSPAPARVRLARGFAWLLRLVPEAASCGSQLRHLLTRGDMTALVSASPQAARLLRPLCRALGVDPAPYLPPPPRRPRAVPTPRSPRLSTGEAGGPSASDPVAAGPFAAGFLAAGPFTAGSFTPDPATEPATAGHGVSGSGVAALGVSGLGIAEPGVTEPSGAPAVFRRAAAPPRDGSRRLPPAGHGRSRAVPLPPIMFPARARASPG